mmetsp:Transcript_106042/g.167468  ORF Transcript_106042/g.167468 Transcript_106042/m.167468 type:complete len:217 (-) Transcript_106042:16-666(-)
MASQRSSSPTAIPRAPSPPPSMETASSPYFTSALLVLKGAAVKALGSQMGGSIEAVKPIDNLCGRLTLNNVPEFPPKSQRNAFSQLVEAKVAEGSDFVVMNVPRAVADELYGGCMYDSPALQGSPPEELRLVCLRDWALRVEPGVVLQSTSLLGRVELTGFKHDKNKAEFYVSFKVHPPDSGETPPVAETTESPPYPLMTDLLPSIAALADNATVE